MMKKIRKCVSKCLGHVSRHRKAGLRGRTLASCAQGPGFHFRSQAIGAKSPLS
jgi:hypothetical protein